MTTKLKEFKGSLNAVFFETATNTEKAFEESGSYQDQLSLAKIKPQKDQPRKSFNQTSLEELALSIKTHGVIQPVIVKPLQDGFFELIAGERRWRASKLAGLTTIPALIKNYDEVNGVAVSLIENIQRQDLNPLEEAEAIHRLIKEFSMTHLEVAKSIGKSRTSVTNMLRLLNLQPKVCSMLRDGLIELGHAKVLLSLPEELQIEMAIAVMQKKLSVRETEKLIENIKNPLKRQEIILDPLFTEKVEQWKKQFKKTTSLNVGVHFDSAGRGGKVVINFKAINEVNWLIENFTFSNMEN